MKILSGLLLVFVCAFLFSCSKADDASPQTTSNPVGVPDTFVKGSAYLMLGVDIAKLNTETGNLLWNRQVNNLAGSSGSELNYDSGYIYHGNHSGVTCYNSLNGNIVWQTSWLSFSNVLNFTKYAFNDSLAFIVSPTSAYDAAFLRCHNKRTGALKWINKIDTASFGAGLFSAIPVVYNNSVITLCRDNSGQRRLTAYNVSTGQKVWSSAPNDQLRAGLTVMNDKVYSVGEYTYCYNASTGAMVWQANTQLANPTTYLGPISHLDGNKLIVTGATPGASSSTILTLNNLTGSTISNIVVNENYHYSMYGNNTLYLTSVGSSTFPLKAYDLSAPTVAKWTYNEFDYYPGIVAGKQIFFSSSQFSFLGLDGKLLRSYNTGPVGKFLFVDSTNKVYARNLF